MLFPHLSHCSIGCDVDNEDLTIDVAMLIGDDDAACGTDYPLGTPATTAQLADARIYIHSVELHDVDADAWSTPVDIDNDFQNGGVILLDGEDGSAGCADSGTTETNLQIQVNAPDVDYDGIRFIVGVPEDRNHLDATTAPAPLNTPGMFWTWQGGFKHVRVDYLAGGARWNVHMGSTGCDSAGPTVAPTTACANSNRGTVTLMDFDPRIDTLRDRPRRSRRRRGHRDQHDGDPTRLHVQPDGARRVRPGLQRGGPRLRDWRLCRGVHGAVALPVTLACEVHLAARR